MSIFGSPIFGGYGFGSLALSPLIVDLSAPPVTGEVKPQQPIDRSMMPMVHMSRLSATGIIPGFAPVPPSTSATFWEMRAFPAIALVYATVVAPILAGTRTMEVEYDMGQRDLAAEMLETAKKDLLPRLQDALGPANEDLNFGNWLQEVIYDRTESRTVPASLNSFLPGEALLHTDRFRNFLGFQVGTEFRDARYAFLSVNQPHIHPVLGFSRNENVKADWWRATRSERNADSIERKASGIQMMIGFPMGQTFTDANGKTIFTQQIMQAIINAAAQNQIISVPYTFFTREAIAQKPELANIPAIRIEKFDHGNMGPILDAHLRRVESSHRNIIRGWGRPERESTEGKHGTKAESESQSERIGIRDCELVHAEKCRQWDRQVGAGRTGVWRLTNYGPDSPILRTVPTPLADEQQEFLQKLQIALATDTRTGPDYGINIDKRGLLAKTEVPLLPQDQVDKAIAEQQATAQTGLTNAPSIAASNGGGDRRFVSRAKVNQRIAAVNGNGRH